MTGVLGHALAMAARGYNVFPLGKLKPKEPIKGKSWLALMTRNPARIKATFKMKDASADTYAVATGDGFVVVDVDVRDGKKGAETYDMLDMEYGFPETFTVRTPTGGFHYYYKIPAGLKVSGDNKDRPVFGPGIDLKAWHGFVVGPGSKTDLGTYEIGKDIPPIDLPPWALERIKLRSERHEKYTEPLQPWDLPENVERVTRYLKYEAEPAIGNASGTLTAYKVACHVRDYAISKDTCRDLMLEHYDPRCEPPFFDEMEYQAAKPYRYAKNRPGTREAGTLAFDAVEIKERQKPKTKPATFTLVTLATVEPIHVEWLWRNYIAIGKLVLFGGDPGDGKSQIAIDVSSRLSNGDRWPNDTTSAPIGSTIFLCSEDGIADTIRPRAEAAGANLNRLHVLKSLIEADGKRKTFSLQNDLAMLSEAVGNCGDVKQVVLDAITSYMGGEIDSHKTTEVRAVLEPVADWAEKMRVAVLGITHPPKARQSKALQNFTGSYAFVAAARTAIGTSDDPDEPGRKLFLPVKNNLGPLPPGIGYKIEQKTISKGIKAPFIAWDTKPVKYTANTAISANAAGQKDGGALNEAKAFLRDLLRDGPVDAGEAAKAATAHGISEGTFKRARKAMGIKAEKTDMKGGWQLSLGADAATEGDQIGAEGVHFPEF